MTKVVKRSGQKQAFNSSKIRKSILKAAKDSGLAVSKTKNLIKEVAEPVISFCKKKKSIKAIKIRKMVLGRLDRRAKAVSRAWRAYDRKSKKN